MIPIQQQQQQTQMVVMNQQYAAMNAYQMQLMQAQRQQQLAALQGIKFDVPQNWTNETTHLRFSQKICCFGQTKIFTQTQNFGRIDFFRGVSCKCGGLNCGKLCDWYGHHEIKYYFNNIPNESCPIEIELCCLKTALIRYKGTVIGKVEALINGCCATSYRFIVKPIDESRPPMVLIPINTCKNKLDVCSNYACRYPRKIEVQRSNQPFTTITNNDEKNPCCTMPCNEQNAFYARGDVQFDPSMKDDEKILLVCGWIIQQGFMSGVL